MTVNPGVKASDWMAFQELLPSGQCLTTPARSGLRNAQLNPQLLKIRNFAARYGFFLGSCMGSAPIESAEPSDRPASP